MNALPCHSCGKEFKVPDDAVAAKLTCPSCGARCVAPARPVDRPEIAGVSPGPTQDVQQPSSTLSRVRRGALKGIGLPFLFVFNTAYEIGIYALYDYFEVRRTPTTPSSSFVSQATGLRLAFVALIALLSVVGGAYAGNAVGGMRGAVIGAGVCYFIGSMSGGAILELLTRRI